MNLRAGMILVTLASDDQGAPSVRAQVLIEGSTHAEFGAPLDPQLLDVRDDIADVVARAADALIGAVRLMPPYEDAPQ